VIERETAARGLFKAHTNLITDMRLQSNTSNILASTDMDGNLFVWTVSVASLSAVQQQQQQQQQQSSDNQTASLLYVVL
jgi:hypothetical protein